MNKWFTAFARCGMIFAMVASTDIAPAEDWPQFRGPDAQGHSAETNLPIEWSATENVRWKRSVPGTGWSSPSLAQGRLYLTSAVPQDAGSSSTAGISLDALCYDARTGELLWQTPVFSQAASAAKIHSKNSHASPTPVVDGDRIYVHFGHQGIACLNTQGEVVWKNSDVTYNPVHGNGGSPALVDGLLIYSCDGAKDPFVVAIDAQTGKVKWKYQRPNDPPRKFAFCTPLVIEVAGKQQVVIPGAGIVNALDPQTGAEIWSVTHNGYSVIPRPVFGHGLVYFSSSFDSPVVMAVRPDGHGDVTETHVAWVAKKGAPHTPSLLLVGDELYMLADKGVLTCLDAKTAKQHWQERIGGNYSSSPIYADGNIYVQSETGQGQVFKAGKTFEKLAENGFDERSLASYAIGDGAIFIRTAENLYRVEKPR